MPLYHTMGIHSLLAMHLIGGCFVPQARWDPGQALDADRGAADHVPVPCADALPRSRPPPRREPPRPLVGAGARLRGCRDDFDARPPLPGRLPAERLCQSLRLHGGLHVHDRAGSEGEAGLRGPARRQHSAPPRRRRRSRFTSPRTRPSAATGTGPRQTRRRFATAGTTRATRAISTRTATSGSTAASTT